VLEGTAMVARAPWALRDNVAWLVPSGGEKFFFQSAELFSTEDTDGSWRLLVNVHGSHKVAHFESAVAVRAWLQGYLARHELRHKLKGVVIAGDFNARLDEESMQPWLLQDPASFDRQLTAIELKALNDDQNYKPWATISPSTWAWSRINKALDIFESVLRGPWLVLSDNLTSHARAGTCDAKASNGLSSACVDDYGIDHVLTSEADPTLNSFVLYPDTTDENTLQRLSDHPGIVVDFP
jgi:hypothetical protein